MIKNFDIVKPNKEKLNFFVSLGSAFFLLGIIDVILDISSFLPIWINFFVPMLFCFLGLYFIRIEFSGNKTLDIINKNINLNWFNSILTILLFFF